MDGALGALDAARRRAGRAARALLGGGQGEGARRCGACGGFGMLRCSKCNGAGRYPVTIPSDYWDRVRRSIDRAPDELIYGEPNVEQSLDGSPWATMYVDCERCGGAGDYKCPHCTDGVITG